MIITTKQPHGCKVDDIVEGNGRTFRVIVILDDHRFEISAAP